MFLIRRLAARDADFARCFEIRRAVFVAEQNVPLDEEADGQDDVALHFLGLEGATAQGTARVSIRDDGSAKISRVAVCRPARGRGLGAALIRAVEAELPLARGFALDAQVQALAFYQRLGFAATGPVFMEAGMAHLHMIKPAA